MGLIGLALEYTATDKAMAVLLPELLMRLIGLDLPEEIATDQELAAIAYSFGEPSAFALDSPAIWSTFCCR